MKLKKHMGIKTILAAMAAMAVQMLSAGNAYYVDANVGGGMGEGGA